VGYDNAGIILASSIRIVTIPMMLLETLSIVLSLIFAPAEHFCVSTPADYHDTDDQHHSENIGVIPSICPRLRHNVIQRI